MTRRLVLAGLALSILAGMAAAQEFTYVGAQKCAVCHKSEAQGRQFPIWEGTKHPKSIEALASPKAAEAAKAMGVEKPADDPRCLKCHSPLAAKAPELKAEGVSCETCHGPGSAYRKLNIMKDRAESAKNGLILYGSPEAIKAQCMTCHENPHGIAFDFASAWDKIKHPLPKK